MSNTLPISVSSISFTKKEDPKKTDIPVIRKFLDSTIFLKPDFIRKTAIINSSPGGFGSTSTFKINFYYNALLPVFDIDEIEVCIYDSGGNKKVLKNVVLGEKMSPREQEIINYLRSSIKFARERKSIVQNKLSNSKHSTGGFGDLSDAAFVEQVIKKILRDSSRENLPNQKLRSQSLRDKFPEVCIKSSQIYLFNQTAFSDKSLVSSRKSPIPLPISKNFEKIQKESYRSNLDLTNSNIFRDECLKTISEGKDPLQAFLNSNLLSNKVSGNSVTPLQESEERLISAFLKYANIVNGSFTGFAYPINFDTSDLYLSTVASNLKKISFDFVKSSLDGYNVESIELKLIKNKNGQREVFETTRAEDAVRESKVFFDTQKINNLGSFPVQYSFRNNPNKKTIVIEREQFHDNRIKTINSHRIVSKSPDLNSGFIVTDTNKKISTEIEIDDTGNFTLNREIILNRKSGEFLVNSTIIDDENFQINTQKFAKESETLSSLRLLSFCVSRKDTNSPVNVLKIVNSNDDIRIGGVVCTPELDGRSFILPFKYVDKEIIHNNPLPGMRYRYDISLIDKFGNHHRDFFSTRILTLPSSPRNISLINQGEVVNERGEKYLRIALPKSGLTNIANSVSSTLDKIFTGQERDFYNDDFKNKLKQNLRNIGQNFELYVSYIAHNNGENLSATNFYEISSEESNPEEFIFMIPVNVAYLKYEIQYNLVLTNPVDLTEIEEDIKDPASKKLFKRTTSKFFATVGRINGIIPVAVSEPNTGDTLYQHGNRYPIGSKLSRCVCLGGYTSVDNSYGEVKHDLSNPKAFYNVDDGDVILGWRVSRVHPEFKRNSHIDFFIITIVVNSGVEIPITAYPFVGFVDYVVRIQSIFGMVKKAKFKIYPVYTDYNIDFGGKIETDEISTKDMRVLGATIIQ